MKFKYEARNREGEMQVGFVEALNREGAMTVLTSNNLFIVSIESSEKVHWYDRVSRYFGGVHAKDMTVFARQLATLLQAHLPLSGTLKVLHDQTKQPVLRQAIQQISDDVASGIPLSQALERHPHIFPGFFISMIRSAEVVGNLEEVSGFLADYLEKEYILATKARSALIYPGIIIALFSVVAFIMIAFVFPQIGPVFEQAGVALPFFSKILINGGAFLAKWWALVVLVVVVICVMLLDYLQTDEGRALLDDFKVRMPLVSKIYVPLTMTRLSNVTSMLLKGGVPVTQAMEIAGQSINNVLYRDLLNDISEEVRQGQTVSSAMAKHPEYFPPLISQMLVVGEATGQIDKMFARLGAFYGREADSVIGNLVDLIQPVLMVVIGLLVGLLFASILLPLYRLTSSIQ